MNNLRTLAALLPIVPALLTVNASSDSTNARASESIRPPTGGAPHPMRQSLGGFDVCGVLVQGVECVLFQDDLFGLLWLLDDFGPFNVGDPVRVVGDLDPGCVNLCLQGGCIHDNCIGPCSPVDPCCPTDINGDGTTNVLDLIELLLCFGQPAIPPCDQADIVPDGNINVLDLIDLLLAFGTACP